MKISAVPAGIGTPSIPLGLLAASAWIIPWPQPLRMREFEGLPSPIPSIV